MIKLTLTNDEAVSLSDILRHYLSDLRMEIADTDSMDFRELLKDKERFIKRMLEELRAALD